MGKTALPEAHRLNAFSMPADKLVIIGLDTKHRCGEHELWDERITRPLSEGFVRNIRRRGVLEPILVRKNGETVEVINGRQRVRAAREATRRNEEEGLPPILVTCMVRRDKGADALDTMIASNENRLEDTPLARAMKAQRLLGYGRSEADVAEAFGITVQQIKNVLAILDLSPTVQAAIGVTVTATAAITLRDLPFEEQDARLPELAGVSVVEAQRLQRVRKSSKDPSSGAPAGNGDNTPRLRPVSVKILRQVAEAEDVLSEWSPDARALLAWILGNANASRRVKGLSKLLRSDQPDEPGSE